jgi:hypothetical protein
VLLPLLGACADDGGGAGGDLADRVREVLAADGAAVPGDLGSARVTCPRVDEPDPGDLATCVVRFDDAREVEVDVEFEADGAITVVAVLER